MVKINTKNKKINFLINSLTSGGAERVATTLLNELCKSGNYKLFLYTLEKDKFYKINKKIKYYSFSNFTIKTNIFIRILFLPFSFLRYLKKTKEQNPDVLISFLEISNFINILTSIILKKPIIISIRTNPSKTYGKGYYGKIHNFLIKKLYPKANKVVPVSKEIKEILINNYNISKGKIEVIYNPHNIKEYQKLSEENLGKKYEKIFKNSFVFINIGRLTEPKGQWFLIRAFKKVVEVYPKSKLIILGEGRLKEDLQKLINKLNLQSNVFLLGNQNNPFKFLKKSDCFVFSSLWEGLPNTVIEALSLNIPIISTDCKTGPREILSPNLKINEEIKYPFFGEFGILTKPFERECVFKSVKEKPLNKEEKMLSNLMIEIIKNEDLIKKYSKGLKRARDFDTKKIIKKWEEIINSF